MDYLINEIPFFQTPNEIFECDLTSNEKIVFMYLCRCGNNGKKAFPSQQTIADKCSISKSTAKRAVNALVDNSYIIKERRFKEGYNKSNIYRVNYTRVTQNLPRVTMNLDRVTVNHYKELDIKNYEEKTNNLHLFQEDTHTILLALEDYTFKRFGKHIRKHDPNKIYNWMVLGFEDDTEEVFDELITCYDNCNLDYLISVERRVQ